MPQLAGTGAKRSTVDLFIEMLRADRILVLYLRQFYFYKFANNTWLVNPAAQTILTKA
jgi:hypothetical protein